MTVEQLIAQLQQVQDQKKEIWLHVGRYWEVRAVSSVEFDSGLVLSD